jgi:hypothetical protein
LWTFKQRLRNYLIGDAILAVLFIVYDAISYGRQTLILGPIVAVTLTAGAVIWAIQMDRYGRKSNERK